MMEEVNKAKRTSLRQLFVREQYYYVLIKRGLDFIARAISARKYGNQKHYKLVRSLVRQHVQDMIKDVKSKKSDYKTIPQMQAFNRINIDLNKILGNEGQFPYAEIQICCNIFKFPIVVFSALNKMSFFDKLFVPEGHVGVHDCPMYLYLVQKSDKHYMMVHRT
jgi:hypothetical protein